MLSYKYIGEKNGILLQSRLIVDNSNVQCISLSSRKILNAFTIKKWWPFRGWMWCNVYMYHNIAWINKYVQILCICYFIIWKAKVPFDDSLSKWFQQTHSVEFKSVSWLGGKKPTTPVLGHSGQILASTY